MLIGTADIDSRRSKRQQIHLLGSENSDSGMKLGRKQAKNRAANLETENSSQVPGQAARKPPCAEILAYPFSKKWGFSARH